MPDCYLPFISFSSAQIIRTIYSRQSEGKRKSGEGAGGGLSEPPERNTDVHAEPGWITMQARMTIRQIETNFIHGHSINVHERSIHVNINAWIRLETTAFSQAAGAYMNLYHCTCPPPTSKDMGTCIALIELHSPA
jgi:hypothetical protein